jgi:DNA topoisomerase IA
MGVTKTFRLFLKKANIPTCRSERENAHPAIIPTEAKYKGD